MEDGTDRGKSERIMNTNVCSESFVFLINKVLEFCFG